MQGVRTRSSAEYVEAQVGQGQWGRSGCVKRKWDGGGGAHCGVLYFMTDGRANLDLRSPWLRRVSHAETIGFNSDPMSNGQAMRKSARDLMRNEGCDWSTTTILEVCWLVVGNYLP